MKNLDDVFKLAGRAAIAAIFIWAAAGKIADPSSTIEHIRGVGVPRPGMAFMAAVFVEAVGGVCLLLGVQTRLAAFGLFLFLIPATYYFHFNLADRMQTIMMLKNIGLMGGLLYVISGGPGRYSIQKG